jgi:hypothetical protein
LRQSFAQHVGQRGGIQQAEIRTLARQRMHHMRGIAHQCQPRGHVMFGVQPPQRKLQAFAGQLQLAQRAVEILFQFELEGLGREARQTFRARRRQRPDDGAAAILERQERQRAVAEETLPGGVLMGFRRAHHGDDGRLAVVGASSGQAAELAHARRSAIGAHHQPGLQRAPVHAQQYLVSLLREREQLTFDEVDTRATQRIGQCRLQHAVLDDHAEIALTHFGGIENQRLAAMWRDIRMPDLHAFVRLGARGANAIPGVTGAQDALAGARQGEHAQIERRASNIREVVRGAPVHHRQARAGDAAAPSQQQGGRQANRARAHHHHVVSGNQAHGSSLLIPAACRAPGAACVRRSPS